MLNGQLLSDAIDDAKAVRATALANAKQALEEAFAPRFDDKFAELVGLPLDRNINIHILKD